MIIKMIEEKGCELSNEEFKEIEKAFRTKDKIGAIDLLSMLKFKFGSEKIKEIFNLYADNKFNDYILECLYFTVETRGYASKPEYNRYIKGTDIPNRIKKLSDNVYEVIKSGK